MPTTNVDAAQVRKTANYLRRFLIACHEKAGLPLAPHETIEPSSELEGLAMLCPGLPDRIGFLVDAAERLRLEVSERELSGLQKELRWILRDETNGREIVRKCFDALFPLPPAVERLERAGDDAPAAVPAEQEEPVSDVAAAAREILCELPTDKGLTGPKLVVALKERGFYTSDSSLRTRIIPALKKRGLKNKPRIGYYVPKSAR